MCTIMHMLSYQLNITLEVLHIARIKWSAFDTLKKREMSIFGYIMRLFVFFWLDFLIRQTRYSHRHIWHRLLTSSQSPQTETLLLRYLWKCTHILLCRQHRVIINRAYSRWTKVKSGVPQGTFLVHLCLLLFIKFRWLECQLSNYSQVTVNYTAI